MTGLQLNPYLLKVPLYIAGKSIEEVQEELGLDDVVKLGSNENPLGPSLMAIEAAEKMLPEAHRYPNYWEKELRRKLGPALDPAFTERNVLIGNGGCDVLRMIAHGFMSEGGETITASATFPMFSILTTMFGGRTVEVPLTADYRFDLPAMQKAVTPATRLIFLCTPNNPTGAIITQGEADAFMAAIPDHVVVVFDESYDGFVADANCVNSFEHIKQGRNVISVRSFSKKSGLANMRVGYAVGRPDLIEYLHHAQMPFNTGSVSLVAAVASLDDHEYQRRSAELAQEEREYLYVAFDELDLNYVHSQANFVLVNDPPVNAKALVDALLRKGVIIRWAGSMGLPNAFRVTVGTHEQNEIFVAALKAVLEEVKATV
ncbi:MAG: histidinol-phosphate transaminase [Chloroflexi bacterium]|nr:histidinol-phosphate transaminase [Chloroflexota bacterium]